MTKCDVPFLYFLSPTYDPILSPDAAQVDFSALEVDNLVMAEKQPFTLVFAPQVKDHLQDIDRKYRSLIRATIDEQLQWEPNVQTKNRKSLREPLLGADWELRLGPNNRFRVLYDIDEENHQVVILAVGIKEGERLIVGGE